MRKIDSVFFENVFDPIITPMINPVGATNQKSLGIASDRKSGAAAIAIRAKPMNRIVRDIVIMLVHS